MREPRVRQSPLEGGGTLERGGTRSREAGTLKRGGTCPRGREPSSEAEPDRGGVSPRARQILLEGAPCWAALVGRGGYRGVGCDVCVCFVLCSRSVCVLCFLQVLSRIPPVFRGPSWLSPTICKINVHPEEQIL
jgi:hypothetical protein